MDFSDHSDGPRSAAWPVILLVVVCLCATICVGLPAYGGSAKEAANAQVGASAAPDDWTILLSEDFEGEFPGAGWILRGEPTWGRVNYRAHSGVWSSYAVGSGSGAVAPPGPYPNDMDAWMIYGPFDLSHATDAEFEFYYWTELAPMEDKLFWGVARSRIVMWFWGDEEEETSGGWQHALYDIGERRPSCLGQPEVWIGFNFESDEAGAAEGVYVDDIVLRVQFQPEMPHKVCLPILVKQRSP